jgi:flagellin
VKGDLDGLRELTRQIREVVDGSGFEGVNLLDGSQTVVRFSADALGDVTLNGRDLRPGGPLVFVSVSAEPSFRYDQIEESMTRVSEVREELGQEAKRIEAHRSFVGILSDAVTGGGADVGVEGARLAALQLRQQLGSQPLSIANQTPQAVLSLFR